jgi:hypothetical protein
MADVFISYARENQRFAQRLADAVRQEGYDVFWDDDLPPHLSYGEVIEEKIANARAAIVIWSKDAAASEWVRAEADLARSHKKLIQTAIDDHPLPMPFNQIQYAAIGDWNGEADHPGWRKVRSSLAALSGRGPPPPTSQPATSRPVAASPAATGERSNAVPAAIVGGLALLAAIGGALFWMRGGNQPDGSSNQLTAKSERSAPVPVSSPRAATALFTKAAVIDDPDGYTNVRSGPADTFPVIGRINRGEIFTTYVQTSQWWQVRTADSRVGFMERSRIRLVEPHATTEGDSGAGETETQPVASDGDADPPQVFADSSRRRLTQSDVSGLSRLQIRLARNEIFARHGRPFQDPRLRRHFERYSWYAPRPGPISLSPVEQANVSLLQRNEAK